MRYDPSTEGPKLAQRYQLGAFNGEVYTTKLTHPARLKRIGAFVFTLICMWVFLGILAAIFSSDPNAVFAIWIGLFLTLLLGPYPLVLVLQSFFWHELRVYVCEDGFIPVLPDGTYSRHWDEIAQVRSAKGSIFVARDRQGQEYYHHTVIAKDGTMIEFTSKLNNVDALGQTLRYKVTLARRQEKSQ